MKHVNTTSEPCQEEMTSHHTILPPGVLHLLLLMCSSCLGIQGGVSRGESRAGITDAQVIKDDSVKLFF